MSTLNPMPQSLRGECNKAAKILQEFTIPSSKHGADKLIPKTLLATCKGIAIITVIRMGFLFTMRAGSGLIVARLPNGDWSAPSAVGLGGMGGGFDIGGEITNFVIVLNTKAAVAAFSKGGNVTLGGSMSVAAGPMGRNAAVDVSVRSPAAVYTYSRTRGLFIGVSIEGSVLLERKAANRKIYGQDVRAKSLLTGVYPPPQEASNLYRALSEVSGGTAAALAHRASSTYDHVRTGSLSSSSRRNTKSFSEAPPRPSRSRAAVSKLKNASHGTARAIRSKLGSNGDTESSSGSRSSSAHRDKNTRGGHSFGLRGHRSHEKATRAHGEEAHGHTPAHGFFDSINTASVHDQDAQRHTRQHAAPAVDWSNPKAKAIYAFKGTEPYDLSFGKGAVIEVLTRTETQNDWWEGRIYDRVGIFPANYVQLQS